MELRTTRLVLRRPVRADAGFVFSVHNDRRTTEHNPGDALHTPEEAEQLLSRWDAHWNRHGFGYWVVVAETPVGFCGAKVMELARQPILNLFYRLAPEHWGRGIASEAAGAVRQWASEVDLPLVARVRPDNVASARIATRIGLQRRPELDGPGFDGFDHIYVSYWPAPRQVPAKPLLDEL